MNDMHNGISSVSETESILGNWEKLHVVVTGDFYESKQAVYYVRDAKSFLFLERHGFASRETLAVAPF